jgi:diadenosine tetraphosphate (Ap4A) HIT family hydrolase
MLVGLEVPHVHVHLIPINSEAQLDLGKADSSVDPKVLDEIAASIAAAVAPSASRG